MMNCVCDCWYRIIHNRKVLSVQNIWFSAVLLLCVGGVGAVTISQAKKMVQFQCGEWKKKSVCLAHWVIDDLLMSAPSYPDLSSAPSYPDLSSPSTSLGTRSTVHTG